MFTAVKRSALSVLVLTVSAAGGAGAIVIRHDANPDHYLADPAGFPAVFGIYRTKEGHPDCLATLVAQRWALTAAHCTQDPPLVNALASGGTYAVSINGEAHAIDAVRRHPSWTGEVQAETFDLALVRLVEPVDAIEPVGLNRDRNEVGRIVLMVGWGDFGTGLEGPNRADGRFRKAENRVAGADGYWLEWDFSAPDSDGAVQLEGISGPGDSGGPAFLVTENGPVLAGISSSQVTGGGPEGLYGVTEYYARVSSAIAWIEDILKGGQ